MKMDSYHVPARVALQSPRNHRKNAWQRTALTALVLVLAACGSGTPPLDVTWLSGYTGVYHLKFTNPAEQFSDSGKYIHLSIFNMSGNKFLGIVRVTFGNLSGSIIGSVVAPGTISITQFGDSIVGIKDILKPVENQCATAPAGVSPLSGGMQAEYLVLSGTVTLSCQYPAGTYSTVASFTIWALKEPDDIPCFSARPPVATGAVSLAASCGTPPSLSVDRRRGA
jgi:hypothetical protein